MPTFYIDNNKRYNTCNKISVIHHDDNILIIIPITANWIVLKTLDQLEIFNFFVKGKSIQDALDNPNFKEEDIVTVVTEIEAKRLFYKTVHPITDEYQTLHIHLTNKCNLSCPHCYMYAGVPNSNELDTQEILSLIKDFRNIAKGTHLTLSGGEPTLHKDFNEIVREAANLGLKVKLLTNGATMSKKQIAEIAQYLYSVQISIDGYSEETNSLIRGPKHLQRALEALDNFIKLGIETSVAITPTLDLLRSHPEGYIEFARKLMWRYRDYGIEIKFSEGLSSGREINLTNEENSEYSKIVQEIQNSIYGDHSDIMTFVDKLSNDAILNNCMYGSVNVSSEGDVYVCPEINRLSPIANIRTSTFLDIYRKAESHKRLSEVSHLSPCRDCELIYICGGGCRIKDFPLFTQLENFDEESFAGPPKRACSESIKHRFYDLMVKSNEYFYRNIANDIMLKQEKEPPA